jgi:hypothetical protein
MLTENDNLIAPGLKENPIMGKVQCTVGNLMIGVNYWNKHFRLILKCNAPDEISG